jgi:hypothetical protein
VRCQTFSVLTKAVERKERYLTPEEARPVSADAWNLDD